MKITISTLPGHDANFGTWLQFISLYKYLEELFQAEPSIVEKPFVSNTMKCASIFQKSFEYFNFKIDDYVNSDYIIIGSDVVLCFSAPWYTDGFFKKILAFDKIPNDKKIIFAGSGINKELIKNSKYYDNFFKHINFLSFREKSTFEQNKTVDYPNWTYCIDPTLLHDIEFYKSLWKKPNIDVPENFSVSYTPHDHLKPKQKLDDTIELYNNPMIGIREFLWMVGNCKTIYTTSYHGTIFGILFGKIVVNDCIQQHKITELFSLFNISVDKDNKVLYDKEKINKVLSKERERSFLFLAKAFLPYIKKHQHYYACFAKKQFIRDLSTSGGISGLAAQYVFQKNGVVYGASYINGFKSVKTIRVTTISLFYKNISKSKYSFCENCDFNIVKKDLDDNKLVLFTGCPCLIKALKTYLNKSYDNLLLLDLACHGYSKQKILKEFIELNENEVKSKVIQLDMRYNHKTQTQVVFDNGIELFYNSYKLFLVDLEENCKSCKIKFTSTEADISVGDFWSYNRYKDKIPLEFSPSNGTNIVRIITIKGYKLFNNIKDNLNYINIDSLKNK